MSWLGWRELWKGQERDVRSWYSRIRVYEKLSSKRCGGERRELTERAAKRFCSLALLDSPHSGFLTYGVSTRQRTRTRKELTIAPLQHLTPPLHSAPSRPILFTQVPPRPTALPPARPLRNQIHLRRRPTRRRRRRASRSPRPPTSSAQLVPRSFTTR